MNELEMNIPAIRFPDFEGEWEKNKIEGFVDFLSGYPFDGLDITDDSTGIPLMRGVNITDGAIRHSTEIDKFYKGDISTLTKYFVKEGDLVIGMDGSKVGRNSAIIDSANANSILVQRVARLREKENASLGFIFQHINSIRFHKYVDEVKTSSGIPHISATQIKEFEIYFPTLPEQYKISGFLSAVDEKLQQLKQEKAHLTQYKKGVMQQIFNQEIRFKDDDGNEFPEWEEKSLGECLDYEQPTNYLVSSTEYDDSYSTPVLTAGKTFILGYTNETNGIFENNLPVIIFDDFTTATQFVNFPFKAKSSAMKILLAKEGINIKFIYEAMQIMNYEVGGHERHWISKFAFILISVPSIAEQTKIANFLNAIDENITNITNQITLTEQWKKGLLQKMFV